MKRRCVTVFVACAALGPLVPAAVAQQQPGSQAAAQAAGDPAGSAASVPMPATFSLDGKPIAPKAAMAKGLVCNQTASGVTCYDSPAQAATAVNSTSFTQPRGARAHTADSTCTSETVLSLFQYAQNTPCYFTGNGWDLTLTGEGAWYDMGSYAYGASAYYMGNHSGHMSDGWGGSGYWVPYSTGVGDYMLSLNGTGWSNRIVSRYRN